MSEKDNPLVWLHGEVKSPTFSEDARLKAGFLLRKLQQGENLKTQKTPQEVIKVCKKDWHVTSNNKYFNIMDNAFTGWIKFQ